MTTLFANPCTCENPQGRVILDTDDDAIITGYRYYCDGCGLITIDLRDSVAEAIYDWNEGLVKYNTSDESTDDIERRTKK